MQNEVNTCLFEAIMELNDKQILIKKILLKKLSTFAYSLRSLIFNRHRSRDFAEQLFPTFWLLFFVFDRLNDLSYYHCVYTQF